MAMHKDELIDGALFIAGALVESAIDGMIPASVPQTAKELIGAVLVFVPAFVSVHKYADPFIQGFGITMLARNFSLNLTALKQYVP